MPTSPISPTTEFTRDVVGRYICNGLDEALNSTPTPVPGVQPAPYARDKVAV
jgi:hypothetical protein